MKVLKKVIVFAFVVNFIVLPINLFITYKYSKVIIYSKNYKVEEVKIINMEPLPYNIRSKFNGWTISYYINKNKESVDVSVGSRSYEHFIKSGGIDEVFGDSISPSLNDMIWVWHNDKTMDFYALGPEDTFDITKYWYKLLFHLLLIILAVWSIYYHLNYKKSNIK